MLWQKLVDVLTEVPPFAVVEADEGGTFLRFGKARRTLGPGFYWKIPFIDRVRKVVTAEQLIPFTVSVTTTDNKSLFFRCVIQYEIRDAETAILCVQDYDVSLPEKAKSLLAEYVSTRSFHRIFIDEIQEKLIKELAPWAEDRGIRIESVGVTDFVEHRLYRVVDGNTGIVINPENQ